MAEVSQYFGRRAQDFAFKVYKSCLRESQNKHGKGVVHASCLSVGFLLDDIKNCDLVNVNDGCARLKRPVTAVGAHSGNEKVVKSYNSHGLKKQALISQRIQSNSFYRYRSCRTLSNSYRCPGHLYRRFVFVREYSGNGTRSEPLYKTKTGYYEILQVSSTATQAQIKTAYYKQSFVYHPDRNAGSDEATARFSEISEAYTVLGNKGLRKKYDRGLLSLSDLNPAARPKDPPGGSGKQSTGSRQSVVGRDSRGGIFDFDKFYRSHYSEQLQRERDIRLRREMLKREQENVSDSKMGRMAEIGFGMLLLFGIGILMSLK